LAASSSESRWDGTPADDDLRQAAEQEEEAMAKSSTAISTAGRQRGRESRRWGRRWWSGSSGEVGEWSCRLRLTSWSGVEASSCIYKPNGGGIESGGELWTKIESSAVCLVMVGAAADSGARERERDHREGRGGVTQ